MTGRRGKSLLFKLLLASVFVPVPAVVQAQSVEIAPFGGWQFGGGFGTQEGLVDVSPTFLSGGGNFLCSLPGGCLIGFNTSASWQGSGTAGVILAF